MNFFDGIYGENWNQMLFSDIDKICSRDRIPYVNFNKLLESKKSNREYVKFNAINEIINDRADDNSVVQFLSLLLGEMKENGLFSKGETENATNKFKQNRIAMFQTNHDNLFNKRNGYECEIKFDRQKARDDSARGLESLFAVCSYLLDCNGGMYKDWPLDEIPDIYLQQAKEGSSPDDEKLKFIIQALKDAFDPKKDDSSAKKSAPKVVYKSGEFKNNPFSDLNESENRDGVTISMDTDSGDITMDKTQYSPSKILQRAYRIYSNYELNSEEKDLRNWIELVLRKKKKANKALKLQSRINFLMDKLNFTIRVKENRKRVGNSDMVVGYTFYMRFLIPETMFKNYQKFFDSTQMSSFCFMPPIKELYELLGVFADDPTKRMNGTVSIVNNEQTQARENEVVVRTSTNWEAGQYLKPSELKSDPKIIKLVDLLLALENDMLQVKIIEEEQVPSNWSNYINVLVDKSQFYIEPDISVDDAIDAAVGEINDEIKPPDDGDEIKPPDDGEEEYDDSDEKENSGEDDWRS